VHVAGVAEGRFVGEDKLRQSFLDGLRRFPVGNADSGIDDAYAVPLFDLPGNLADTRSNNGENFIGQSFLKYSRER
jgi:hypothetical protein